MKIKPVANSGFAKVEVSCFYESNVLNPSFVLLLKFSAEKPRPNAKQRTVLRDDKQDTKMPEKEKKDYHKQVDENIRKFGYHQTFVFSDKSPSFCYSTGIYKSFHIPEIFISSLPKNLSFELVDSYVQLFKETKAIRVDTKIDHLTDRFPVYLIEVPKLNLQNYVLSTLRFYGSQDYEYLQMIYPDTEGHFPNDKDYNYDQEIIGKFNN